MRTFTCRAATRSASRAAALVVILGVAGCAASDLAPSAEPTAPTIEAEPAWKVGYTWTLMNDSRLFAATRTTLETCVVGRTVGLETVEITSTERGFEVLDTATGERRLWMEIIAPPGAEQNRTLNLNWVDGVGPEARVAFLRAVDRAVMLEAPC